MTGSIRVDAEVESPERAPKRIADREISLRNKSQTPPSSLSRAGRL